MELTKRTLKQVKNLENKCDFDLKKGIARIVLHYDSAKELIDEHFSKNDFPVISEDMIDYIQDIISSVPKEFKVEFLLNVDDYCGYTYDQLLNSLKMSVENIYYYFDENRKKDNLLAVIFIIIGIILVAFENIGNAVGWYGNNGTITRTMIETLYEVFTWAFIWEGAAILLLTYSNEATLFANDMCRINGIGFIDNNKDVISFINEDSFYNGWINLSRREIISRNLVLFLNAVLLGIASVYMVEFIAYLPQLKVYDIVYAVFSNIVLVVLAISNISFYREKGKLKNWAIPLSIIFLITNFVDIIYLIRTRFSNKSFLTLDIIFVLYLIINIICLNFLKKQRVDVRNDVEY